MIEAPWMTACARHPAPPPALIIGKPQRVNPPPFTLAGDVLHNIEKAACRRGLTSIAVRLTTRQADAFGAPDPLERLWPAYLAYAAQPGRGRDFVLVRVLPGPGVSPEHADAMGRRAALDALAARASLSADVMS